MQTAEWALVIYTILIQMAVGAFLILGAMHVLAYRKAGAEEADRLSDRALYAIGPVVVIGVLASAVSAFYYLRIVKIMYFDEPTATFESVPSELNIIMGVTGFLLVTYYFTVGAPLANLAHAAAGSLF